MRYNKSQLSNKPIISGGGPRDIQKRQAEASQIGLVEDLKQQINSLQNKIEQGFAPNADNLYTEAQFNEAVTQAVQAEVEHIHSKYVLTIEKLEHENKILKETNERLTSNSNPNFSEEQLKQMITHAVNQASNNIVPEVKNDRPRMETVFVDPLDNKNIKEMETHIKVKEDFSSKEKINDKLSKLKNIIGSSLPIKKGF